MSSSLLLLLSLSLFWLVAVAATSHGGLHMEEEGGNGCTVSNVSYLKSAINSSEGYNLTSIVINCLQYADNRSTLAFGSISYANIDGSSGRYSVHCSSSSTFLLLSTSEASYSSERYSCYQCEDAENPCVSNTECPLYCDQCLPSSECLSCTYAKYNGMCYPNSTCPNGGTPNPQKGNECECPMNRNSTNCDDCLLDKGDCPHNKYLDSENCICISNCSHYRVLFNPESRVPDCVIGSPGTGEEGHHRKRATEEGGDSHGGGSSCSNDTDRTYCVQKCPNPCNSCDSCGSCDSWSANHDTNGVCYACGINYCLDCNRYGDCTRCRNGTLLTTSHPHHCIGFYDYVRELNETLHEEEEHEKEKFEQEKLELQIALPIICAFVIIIFILVAIFAHFRYPHVGKDKRHRDPAKRADTNPDTIESRFRPQSTVRYR